MRNTLIKSTVVTGAFVAVLLPLSVHVRNTSWNGPLTGAIFPMFGLLAAGLLWLHAISGVFEEWLRKHFDFDAFVHWTAILILVSIILHPLLLLVLINFQVGLLLSSHSLPIWLGVVSFILLISYDIGKALKKFDFFARHWNAILILSTIGFLLSFLHSLLLGSDLQSGFLRTLWIFYGVTAVLATIYTYGVKPFLRKS